MDVIHLVGSKCNLINCRIIVNCELVSDYAAGRKLKFLGKKHYCPCNVICRLFADKNSI